MRIAGLNIAAGPIYFTSRVQNAKADKRAALESPPGRGIKATKPHLPSNPVAFARVAPGGHLNWVLCGKKLNSQL
jgi:hypothetical protein